MPLLENVRDLKLTLEKKNTLITRCAAYYKRQYKQREAKVGLQLFVWKKEMQVMISPTAL